MTTTYTIYITCGASRANQDLASHLVANHPPAERAYIRVITLLLAFDQHIEFYSHPKQQRYMRIFVDTPKGRLQDSECKRAFLSKTVEACLEYQGKKANVTEIEVRINEFEKEDVARFTAGRI